MKLFSNLSLASLVSMIFLIVTNGQLLAQAKVRAIYSAAPITVVPSQITNDWSPSIQHLEMPFPGGNGDRAQLLKMKEEVESKLSENSGAIRKSNRISKPSKGQNFQGNIYNNRVPNDNDLAISNGGKLVSVINSTIYFFDTEMDSLLGAYSLSGFAQSLGITYSMYDPKVEYDPESDRFVMIWLAGTLDSTSSIILAFSQTADPMQNWNLYSLPGNPLNNNTWSDYPVTGLSRYELFIGINTFTNGSTNNSGFTESCLWQVRLRDGYEGNPLSTQHYSNILQTNKPVFNICPVTGGSTTYGPHMYLLSNRNLDAINDTIFLIEVTDTIGAAQLNVSNLLVPGGYFLPISAKQPYSHTFDTNDSRILGAFLENGKIQFVQSCTDTATQRVGVYHGIITNVGSAPVVSAQLYSDTLLDLGFPNIAYAGIQPGDDHAIIGVNHSAASVFSGCSAFSFDGAGNYSDLLVIKEGLNYVNVINGAYERWGDYSGAQRKYNEPGIVWTAGSFGRANRTNGTWITKLGRIPFAGVADNRDRETTMNVFPNPFHQQFTIDFELPQSDFLTFSLYDMHGKLVAELLKEQVRKGSNSFAFSLGSIPAGSYVLSIRGSEFLTSRSIIRQ